MEIEWLMAVIDLPADRFDEVGQFWATVSGTTRGEADPAHDEFVHLDPPTGDMHLELQRTGDGSVGVHLDLLVADIPAWVARAIELGATVVSHPGHAVLATPGGLEFCFVPYGAEGERAPLVDPDLPHAVDQLCIDLPHDRFDDDVIFWSNLTGWPTHPPSASFPEFLALDQPAHLPLQLLFQRLGPDDSGRPRAHLDISAGERRDDVVAAHEAVGAKILQRHDRWTAMLDPAGQPYCITRRPPSRTS